MEKGRNKTLAGASNGGAECAKLVLLAALFLPALLSFGRVPARLEQSAQTPADNFFTRIERSRSEELLRAYSIVKSRRPDIPDTDAWRISEVILAESSKRRLDPLLVLAIIQIESDFRHAAVSPVGARGLMQIMPDTGKYLADALHRERGLRPVDFRPETLDDPLQNIRLGTYYLHALRKQFRNITLTLIAYNLGPGEVKNRIENNLEFSDDFASGVLETYQHFKKTAPRF